MVLVGQLEDKMIFTESGTCLQIVKTDELSCDTPIELFFDGEVSGGKDYFQYAIIFKSPSEAPVIMGVYTDYNSAETALKNIVRTIEIQSQQTVLSFEFFKNNANAIS